MSLVNYIGKRGNILDLEASDYSNCIKVNQPILKEADINKIVEFTENNPDSFKIKQLDTTFIKNENENSLEKKLSELCNEAEQYVNDGANLIILSDKNISENNIPIPALLAVSAVHHHLIEKGLRTSAGLIVETAEAREIHHFCCLAGYGADAISPWLALRKVKELAPDIKEKAQDNYIKACGKGILKVMSKMGISTYQSYCGCLLYTSPSPRDGLLSRMPSSA